MFSSSDRDSGRAARACGAAALSVLLLAAARAAADAPPADGMLTITLAGGIAYRGPAGSRGAAVDKRAVQIDVIRRDGAWAAEAWGFDAALAGLEHRGKVVAIDETGGRLRLRVRLAVAHWPRYERLGGYLVGCTVGGRAEYAIELTRWGGAWRGTYSGELKAIDPAWLRGPPASATERERRYDPVGRAVRLASGPVSGAAGAALVPLPRRRPGHRPIPRGEHPRLLFGKGDVAALRRRAGTPQGRRIVEKLAASLDRERLGFRFLGPSARTYMEGNWAAGHALMYVLTGRREHVERARRLLVSALHAPVGVHGNYGFAHRIMGTAVTYDLLYDELDADLRRKIAAFLERNARRTMTFTQGRNPLGVGEKLRFGTDRGELDAFPCPMPASPRDPHAAMFRAAAGLAAMAICGDPVELRRPTRPADAAAIAPAAGYEPPVGVPVVAFTDNKMPPVWLINGPFVKSGGADPLAAIGGVARAHPVPGTTVTSAGVELDFRRFYANRRATADPHDPLTWALWPRNNQAALSYSPKYGGYKPAAAVLAKVDADQLVPKYYYLYTVLANGAERVVQARPNWGSHGATAVLYVGGRRLRDGELARLKAGRYPVMVEISPLGGYAASAPRLAEYVAEDYRRDLSDYEAAVKAYEAAGREMPGVRGHLRAAARAVRRYLRTAIDPNGLGADGLETLLPFLQAYRRVEGIDLAEGTGLKQILRPIVRRAMAPGPADHLAVSQGFGLLPAAHRPVAKGYLDARGLLMDRPDEALLALLTHRPELPAAAPGSAFSLAGEYGDHGVYSFTSAWADANAFQVLVRRGTGPLDEPCVGGHFSVRGLGRLWAAGPARRQDRDHANVVLLANLYRAAEARCVHAEFRPDGSGVVSLLADRFHRGFAYRQGSRRRVVLDKRSRPGVSILRSIAVDFSGASGAPALIAVADRIVGAAGREKTWRLHTGRHATEYNGRSFTVALRGGRPGGGGALSLHGTFVWPPKAKLALGRPNRSGSPAGLCHVSTDRPAGHPDVDPTERLLKTLQQLRDPHHREKHSHDDLLAEQLEADFLKHLERRDAKRRNDNQVASFLFVVMTVQAGPPPVPTVTGTAEGTAVTVGRQRIAFDGKRIVLGE